MNTDIPIANALRFDKQSVSTDEALAKTANDLAKGNPQLFGVVCDPELKLVLIVGAQDAATATRKMVFNYITKRRNGEDFLIPLGSFPKVTLAKARFEATFLKSSEDAGVNLDQLPYLLKGSEQVDELEEREEPRHPMKVISVLNQKGGVGKTTIAVNLAAFLAGEKTKKREVVLVDADPQGSALDWHGFRAEREAAFSVVGYPKENLHTAVKSIGGNADFVVVDGAPRVTDLSRSAIMASDLILIPVQPSPYDIWASSDIVRLIGEARVYRPDIQAALVINRRVGNTVIGKEAREALVRFGLPVLDAQLWQRVVYANSASLGQTVFEAEPDGAGAKEMRALGAEVLVMINKKE